MKFNLVTIIAVMMVVGAASAQPVNFGIKGGLNVFTINSNNGQSYNNRPSVHVGFLGHIHMADQFAIQPEIVFSSQGAKYGDDQTLQLNYLNMPILFQYMFDNGFRLQAGPQVGLMVGAKEDGTDVKSDFKGGDMGLTFGASYVNPLTGFGFDARYNHGFTNINESDANSSYNRGVQVGVFYLFKHRS